MTVDPHMLFKGFHDHNMLLAFLVTWCYPPSFRLLCWFGLEKPCVHTKSLVYTPCITRGASIAELSSWGPRPVHFHKLSRYLKWSHLLLTIHIFIMSMGHRYRHHCHSGQK